ncbi:MAG TPA: tetratricopeptide repeat protein [Thermoanaerobaculia bacterium]
MSDGAFSDRVTQLKNRWDADPTSRVFLQLAEEYRHQGRVKEALEVLDRGLKEHPGYLSALVAKGRCHLELGEPEPARAVLERVVKQDATQMVANKLLVRAYLDTGEPERARERLDLYSLLNDSDPEIEELRRRLRAMEQPPQPPPTSDNPFSDLAPPPAPPRPEAAASTGSAARAAAGGEDIFDLGMPARVSHPVAVPVADEPFGDLWTPPAPAAPPPASAAVAPAAAPAAVAVAEMEEPEPEDVIFPGLASRESRSRYLNALAAEGLFAFDLTAAAAAAPAVLEPEPVEPEPFAAVTPEPAPQPEPEPVLAFHEESAVETMEPPPALEEMAPAALEEPEPVAAAPAAVVTGFSWEVVEEPAPIAAPEPAQPEAPVFEIEEQTPWAVEPEPITPGIAPEIVPEPAVLETAPPQPAPPSAAEPVATVTLGELYLRQDHPGEAKRIFEEVLRREPDNAVAREALAELATRQRPLAARDLMAGYEPGEEGGEAEAKARKVFLLNSYLKRLRRGSQGHVS